MFELTKISENIATISENKYKKTKLIPLYLYDCYNSDWDHRDSPNSRQMK